MPIIKSDKPNKTILLPAVNRPQFLNQSSARMLLLPMTLCERFWKASAINQLLFKSIIKKKDCALVGGTQSF